MSAGRDELVRRLRDEAILWARRGQPVLHRDGRPAPWAFYSWNLTQTQGGLRLAAEAMLERLASFRSTQLAGYGLTAGPLLSACVLLGGSRYTGLSIRARPKAYLSCRQIEGPADRTRPVVIVDDSLSSGTSLAAAIRALEDDGFVVEGAVALVGFPNRGGLEWATDQGYRVECLFDIWRDIDPAPRPRRPEPPRLPANAGGGLMPEGVHPAALARRVAEEYVIAGTVPRPPMRLNDRYDSRGGVFVSFRERTTDMRVARNGFWRWDISDADPARDVVLGTVDTVRTHPATITLATLSRLKIAVTFFGPLTEIDPGDLDFDRYGIVVHSRAFPSKIGGALPNTQVFTSEVAQYAHARDYNARLDYGEDHVLYRHEVRKFPEPGANWPLYGQAADPAELGWIHDRELGRALCQRARETIWPSTRQLTASQLPHRGAPRGVTAVAVGLYRHGLSGLGLAWGPGRLESLVDQAAAAAAADARVLPGAQPLDTIVSLLHHPENIGTGQREIAAIKVRRGLDAVVAFSGAVRCAVLPSALVYNDWSSRGQVAAAERRLGKPASEVTWSIHQVATWLATPTATDVESVRSGYVMRSPIPLDDERAAAYTEMLGEFVLRSIGPDGLPAYMLNPVNGEVTHYGTAARAIHALGALHRAGLVLAREAWCNAARLGLRATLTHIAPNGSVDLPCRVNGPLADAVLLTALADAGGPELATQQCIALANRVNRLARADGLIADGPPRLNVPWDHRFLPGAVIKAIAVWAKATGATVPPGWLHQQLVTYRRHFRNLRAWGSAGWLPQGWSAAHDLSRDPQQQEFVFEVTDWALVRQLKKNGAFLEDMGGGEPSFNTGFIAEGVAAAWATAKLAGDQSRAEQYERSWRAALGFVSTLVIHRQDTFCLKAAERAVGGVRSVPSSSQVRIDQVGHTLNALVSGLALLK